jgi:hypothetical protein
MLGLDKKCIEMLRRLRDMDAMSEPHRILVMDMLEKYSDPTWHFFTSSQRRLIKDLHAMYAEPPSRADRELLAGMDEALCGPNTSEYERGKLQELFDRHGRNPKMFPPWGLQMVKDLFRDLKTRGKQADVRRRLEEALDAGQVRLGAEDFCRSIIQQFDERRRWSPVQMEHAEKILRHNEDPGDDEVPT